jgi:hypothetical protein
MLAFTQWGGAVGIGGGGGSTMFAQYRSRYNVMAGWESPLEIDLLLDPGCETISADITVTGDITSTNNKVIVIVTNHQTDDYFCSAITYDEYDFDLTTIGETRTFVHQINASGYDIDNLSIAVLVQTLSGDHQILQAGRVIVSEATVPLQVENIEFDPVMVGETAIQTIELFNYSDDALTGMMFAPPGFNAPADFSIPAHSIGEVEIEFAPQQAMMYNDILIVTTSQVEYPNFFINMSGEGLPINHQDDNQISQAITLHGNYPNPFNPETTISYDVTNYGNVVLAIFNLKGELVAELVNEIQSAGSYQVVWQAEDMSSGMYLAHLISDNQIAEQKMILLK